LRLQLVLIAPNPDLVDPSEIVILEQREFHLDTKPGWGKPELLLFLPQPLLLVHRRLRHLYLCRFSISIWDCWELRSCVWNKLWLLIPICITDRAG
jgi:hypothetical protein